MAPFLRGTYNGSLSNGVQRIAPFLRGTENVSLLYGIVFKYLYSAPQQPWANRGIQRMTPFSAPLSKGYREWLFSKGVQGMAPFLRGYSVSLCAVLFACLYIVGYSSFYA